GRLHERVADGRADELESAPEQIAAQRVRLCRSRRQVAERSPAVDSRLAADEGPDVRIEGPVLSLTGEKPLRVGAGAVDLEPVANDARILEQLRDACRREA